VIVDVITLGPNPVQHFWEWQPVKKIRFSIGMVLALTALVALAISHVRTSWRLNEVSAQNDWLKSARVKSWPKPNLINVVSVDHPTAGFKPANNNATWRWIVSLPESTDFYLHCQESPNSLDHIKKSLGTETPLGIKLPAGQFDLEIVLKKGEDGTYKLMVSAGDAFANIAVPQGCDVFSFSGTFQWIAGISQTESAAPAGRFLLISVKEAPARTTPPQAFRVWLEPVR